MAAELDAVASRSDVHRGSPSRQVSCSTSTTTAYGCGRIVARTALRDDRAARGRRSGADRRAGVQQRSRRPRLGPTVTVTFDDGGVLRVNDPRRWADVRAGPVHSNGSARTSSMSPPITCSTRSPDVARRSRPLLLDQRVVAGYGNMCVDEVLWQTGICAGDAGPGRSGRGGRAARAVRSAAPAAHARTTAAAIAARSPPRSVQRVPPCPRDGAPMRRDEVGGRTTIWCPAHQIDRGARIVAGEGRRSVHRVAHWWRRDDRSASLGEPARDDR